MTTSAVLMSRWHTARPSGCLRFTPKDRFVRLEEAKDGFISVPAIVRMKSGIGASLDLDHVGAELGQQPAAFDADTADSEIQHPHPGQRPGRSRHGGDGILPGG